MLKSEIAKRFYDEDLSLEAFACGCANVCVCAPGSFEVHNSNKGSQTIVPFAENSVNASAVSPSGWCASR